MKKMDNKILKLISYNSTGLGLYKMDYICELLTQHNVDIMFLQETWLLPSTQNKLNGINKNYCSHGISGMDNHNLLQGRPYGGLAFLWKQSLSPSIKCVTDYKSKRICAVTIECANIKLLLINVYLPVDNYSKTVASDEFIDVCDVIEYLSSRYDDHTIIIGGDFNCDFERANANDQYMTNMLERLNMTLCWELQSASKGYTFYNDYLKAKSTLDHFCFANGITTAVCEVTVIDCPFNVSGHRPISAAVDITPSKYQQNCVTSIRDRIAWHKVTQTDINRYRLNLHHLLSMLPAYDSCYCRDLNCEDPCHLDQINLLCNNITNCCIQAAAALPKIGQIRKSKQVPGWKEHVKPFKNECKWWFTHWKSVGRPTFGAIYENMRESGRQYYYAIRRCKRRERQLRYEKMADCIANNNSRQFFQEIKKVKSHAKSPTCVNGKTNPADIALSFSTKWKELYNSVPSEDNWTDLYKCELSKQLPTISSESLIIDTDSVRSAVDKLRWDKQDGCGELFSNHIKYGGDKLYVKLSELFTAILMHGFIPDKLRCATIHFIPKDNNGDFNSDCNYRGIALISPIAKLYDLIFIRRNQDKLFSSEQQFAFKAMHETAMCTLTIKEVVHYYMRNKSNVLACMIDASKAFDRIRHDMLFKLLMKRNIPPADLRSLLDLYTRQETRTEWKGNYSEPFASTNGIRQGGVASPLLYAIYMDELIMRLKQIGIGCWMGTHYCGAVSYADDLTLMSPTNAGLQEMIKVCEVYAQEYGV